MLHLHLYRQIVTNRCGEKLEVLELIASRYNRFLALLKAIVADLGKLKRGISDKFPLELSVVRVHGVRECFQQSVR